MDVRIDDLISNNSTHSDSGITGVQYSKVYGLKRKFGVLPQKLDAFLDDFCDICSEDYKLENGDEELDMYSIGHPIAEVINKETIPINVTLKFSFKQEDVGDEESSLFDTDFLVKVAQTIQKCVVNKITISPNLYELITTVEESKHWTLNGMVYCQLRFLLPYCPVDVGYQRGKFRSYLIEQFKVQQILNLMDIKPTGSLETIFQEIKESILMYRGKEDAMSYPMSLTHIYPLIINAEEFKEPKLTEVFLPSSYSHIQKNITSSDFLTDKDVDPEHWIPMFLSIHFWSQDCIVKESNMDYSEGGDIEYDENAKSSAPSDMCQYLLPHLSTDRFNVEPFWKEIVQILFNIFNGGDQGLRLAIQCSQRATVEGRDKDAVTYLYRTLTKNHLTIKTIGWYVRSDSPDKYKTWHSFWCRDALFEALDPTHDNVAEIIYRTFWLDHIWTGGKKWYKFYGHRLNLEDDATDLKRDIREILIPIYRKLRQESSSVGEDISAVERKEAEGRIKLVGNLIAKLQNQSFKSQIIKACQEHFEIKNFEQVKDADPSKTGWTNCVVVCSGKNAYTIDGKLEDFITKSTFTPFRYDFTWEHPVVVRLMDWLGKVFPDKDLLHFFLKDAASMLYGRNSEKLLRAWCGDGDNSKSMLAKAYQAWLGLYCVDCPPDMLTAKKQNEGPSPAMAQLAGAHCGLIPETESDEKIREGTAKRVTGGDRFFARFLNDNGGSVDMMAKLILMCNRIPEFTSVTKALRNRFIYIPFLSTWSMKAPESEEDQRRTRTFKMDPNFDSQIPELSQALGWVAVQYFPIYKEEGLKQPSIIEEYTQRHWEENDPIKGFLQDRVVQARLPTGEVDVTRSLNVTEMYGSFKQWFTSNYPGDTPPSSAEFRSNMLQTIGAQKNRRWLGIQLVEVATVLGQGGSGSLQAQRG
jgi:phage/plasmid-associated DNA primase